MNPNPPPNNNSNNGNNDFIIPDNQPSTNFAQSNLPNNPAGSMQNTSANPWQNNPQTSPQVQQPNINPVSPNSNPAPAVPAVPFDANDPTVVNPSTLKSPANNTAEEESFFEQIRREQTEKNPMNFGKPAVEVSAPLNNAEPHPSAGQSSAEPRHEDQASQPEVDPEWQRALAKLQAPVQTTPPQQQIPVPSQTVDTQPAWQPPQQPSQAAPLQNFQPAPPAAQPAFPPLNQTSAVPSQTQQIPDPSLGFTQQPAQSQPTMNQYQMAPPAPPQPTSFPAPPVQNQPPAPPQNSMPTPPAWQPQSPEPIQPSGPAAPLVQTPPTLPMQTPETPVIKPEGGAAFDEPRAAFDEPRAASASDGSSVEPKQKTEEAKKEDSAEPPKKTSFFDTPPEGKNQKDKKGTEGTEEQSKKVVEENKSVDSDIKLPKKKLLRPTKKLTAVLFLGAIGIPAMVLGYLMLQNGQVGKAQNVASSSANDIVGKVAALVALPVDESPSQIANVSDTTKLSTNPFFAHAQNGDVVLIYQKSQEAVLYRPSTNKVISIGPLTNAGTQSVAGVSTSNSPTPTPTVSVVGSPTPTITPIPTKKAEVIPTGAAQESPTPTPNQ